MFDTHCHLQADDFDADRDAVLVEAEDAGVTHFLVPATDLASFSGTLDLAAHHENVYCGLGIHPHSAMEWNAGVREKIREESAASDKLVAIGEIGLDYHYDFAPRDVQRKAFAEQIELAIELGLPIVIHSRESDEDVYRIVEEYYSSGGLSGLKPGPPGGLNGQFHCFSSTVEYMQKAVSLGFYVSFTGNITFKKSTLSDVVREVPLERLLIETDSPYMAPVPFRGKRNSPVFLRMIAEKIAEIKAIDVSIIQEHTLANALKLFRITQPLLVVLFVAGFLSLAGSIDLGSARAQRTEPAGKVAPDSVMTAERRKAEELRKKQAEVLAKEMEQHRLDSIKAAAAEQEAAMATAREQLRQDSIKAVQRLLEEQQQAEFLLTPLPWRAVGLGFSAGVGNMQMAPLKPVATTVFAYSIDAGTQISRRLDFDFSYSHMAVSDNYLLDSIWSNGPGTPPSRKHYPGFEQGNTQFITSEAFTSSWWSFDFRYIITRPTSWIRFYLGLGYTYIVMTNTQHFVNMHDSTPVSGDQVYQKSFDRSALTFIFGFRHDFELGSGVTLEPYAQIGTIAAFQGQAQEPSFVLGPARDLLIMTHLRVGFSLFYGWFGVPRQ